MRATLYTHTEWFKLQMCKDRFEGLLKIDLLKEVSPLFLNGAAATKSNADNSSTHGSSQVTVSSSTRMQEDGNSPTQASSRDVVCDENAILKVMVSTSFTFPFRPAIFSSNLLSTRNSLLSNYCMLTHNL